MEVWKGLSGQMRNTEAHRQQEEEATTVLQDQRDETLLLETSVALWSVTGGDSRGEGRSCWKLNKGRAAAS